MYDIDEPNDVWELTERLFNERSRKEETDDSLLKNSPLPLDTVSLVCDDGMGLPCKWTRKALMELSLVEKREENGRHFFLIARDNFAVG